MNRDLDPTELPAAFRRFFQQAAAHPELGPNLAAPGRSFRLIFRSPEARLTLRPLPSGPPWLSVNPEDDDPVDATVEMDAWIAHQIFLGRRSLEMSVFTSQIRLVGGGMGGLTGLLPALKRAFRLYPSSLTEDGL